MSQPQPPVALYVHLPFCVARCPYCDFVVYAGPDARGPRSRAGRLYEAVACELELRADRLDATFGPATVAGDGGTAAAAGSGTMPEGSRQWIAAARDRTPSPKPITPREARPLLDSVYFGGGTPSLAPAAVLERLLGIVASRYGIAPDAEITLEMNPGPDERGDLAAFARLGVNRVSIGAQSLDPGELRRLGRRHSPAAVAVAVELVRAAGIGSINLDLLYDIPGQSIGSWEATLRAALDLAPDHLSLYALTLDDPDAEGLTGDGGDHLPTPPGARKWRDRARPEQDDDRAAEQYGIAFELLGDQGWQGYEISNWSRPGHESRHNLAYWRRLSYEAVGPGAHAFDGVTRRWSSAALGPYLAALLPSEARPGPAAPEQPAIDVPAHAPALPPGGEEVVTPAGAAAEAAILALRLDRGIAESDAVTAPLAGVVAWGLESGLLERVVTGGERCLRLTLRGRLLSNELFTRLI